MIFISVHRILCKFSDIILNRRKDRWRQVLNEADRIETKYLFTLQQGISRNQLLEMRHEHLRLVVPASYRTSFDKEFQPEIETLASFIEMVKSKQRGNP